MTMLDRMRRHKNWLKWSLALVVLAFVLLYIPGLPPRFAGAGLNDAIATVEGSEITVNEFRRAYQRQMQQYRAAYGASMDERLLKQLGIDQRIVQQLIEEEAALAEAKRLGHHGDRRRGTPAHPGNPRLPGERAVHRLRPIPADAADAESAGPRKPSSKNRSAAASSSRSFRRR